MNSSTWGEILVDFGYRCGICHVFGEVSCNPRVVWPGWECVTCDCFLQKAITVYEWYTMYPFNIYIHSLLTKYVCFMKNKWWIWYLNARLLWVFRWARAYPTRSCVQTVDGIMSLQYRMSAWRMPSPCPWKSILISLPFGWWWWWWWWWWD